MITVGQSWSKDPIIPHPNAETFWHICAKDLEAFGDFCVNSRPRWIEGGAGLAYPGEIKSRPGPKLDLTSSKSACRRALDHTRQDCEAAGPGPHWLELCVTEPHTRAEMIKLHQGYSIAGLCHWGPITPDVLAAYPENTRYIAVLGPEFREIAQTEIPEILFTEAPEVAAKQNIRWGEGACACSTCQNYTPEVLQHLFEQVPLLAMRLNFIHNLVYLENYLRNR